MRNLTNVPILLIKRWLLLTGECYPCLSIKLPLIFVHLGWISTYLDVREEYVYNVPKMLLISWVYTFALTHGTLCLVHAWNLVNWCSWRSGYNLKKKKFIIWFLLEKFVPLPLFYNLQFDANLVVFFFLNSMKWFITRMFKLEVRCGFTSFNIFFYKLVMHGSHGRNLNFHFILGRISNLYWYVIIIKRQRV